jgi:hypothetical protein
LGKYGTAAPHTDTDSHAYAEPNSLDLADSFYVPDSDSDVQRDTLAHVTTANPSHIRVSDANAERIVLTGNNCWLRRYLGHRARDCSIHPQCRQLDSPRWIGRSAGDAEEM